MVFPTANVAPSFFSRFHDPQLGEVSESLHSGRRGSLFIGPLSRSLSGVFARRNTVVFKVILIKNK